MSINTTGEVIDIYDPLSVHIENVTTDLSRLISFVTSNYLRWNYPEAVNQGEFYVNNLIAENSLRKLLYKANLIDTSLARNFSLNNLDWRKQYTFFDLIRPWTILYLSADCLPDDGLPQIQYLNGHLFSNKFKNLDDSTILMTGMVYVYPHYRIIHGSINNFVIEDVNQDSAFNIVGILGSFAETIKMNNILLK